MRVARPLVVVCLAATSFFAGCYRATPQAARGTASSATAKADGTKPFVPPPAIVHGTDIADDRNNKGLQTVSVEQLRREGEERAAKAAAANAAFERVAAGKSSIAPAPTSSATATPTATAATPTASPSASAAETGTAVALAPQAAPFDPYLRPPMPRASSSSTAEVRPSRSPPRPAKAGSAPPPRTRVLAAPETAGGVLGITFDSLMFDMKPTDYFSPSLLSDSVRALFDKKVKIRGYIHPASCPVMKGVTSFILVRDDQGCCFGPGALLYDNIMVKMVPGKTTSFSVRPIAVEGVLTYHEVKSLGDQPVSIFQIDAESAE